jgi:hypothetical protein
MKPTLHRPLQPRGFALVVTISLMVLLAIIAVGLLGLSAISLRGSSQGNAKAVAEANARLGLMIAIGELQKEMGPDSRISAESAIFDSNAETEKVEGLAQSRWLASYNAWGDWLNSTHTLPNGGGSLRIGDTYNARRDRMFRRWLLSMPENAENSIKAPDSLSWDDTNSVVLVGDGSLGKSAGSNPDQVTRAWLTPIGKTGKHAWWISPENHKARIDKAYEPRNLSTDAWQVAHGSTAEVGVGGLDGFAMLDADSKLGEKLITHQSLRPAKVAKEDVEERFFDLTAHSRGVLASVRTGQLKRDLSLLFEMDGSKLPDPYRFNPTRDIVEPSIRPMSPEIAKRAELKNRHFQSWTNMRHYYRMYRSGSDATLGGTGGPGVVSWSGSKPRSEVVSTANLANTNAWTGSNNYWRVPILAKITFIYSLLAEPFGTSGRWKCYHLYSPVFTFWNPYNTELRIPDGVLTMASSAYRVWPHGGSFYLNGVLKQNPYVDQTSNSKDSFNNFAYSQGINSMSVLKSGGRGDIIFKPGEFRVFSHKTRYENNDGAKQGNEAHLLPGFDPQAAAGEKKDYKEFSPKGKEDGTFSTNDKPGLTVTFSHGLWGGNINRGNTGGSLCWQDWWDRPTHQEGMPMTYANDWFNKAQTMTPMTPVGVSNVAQWVFDGKPLPVAFCQLVIKGASQFDYQSISQQNPPPHNWARDWRCRNWVQSPPFYFGHGMYCSESETTAHTQRIDNPYLVYFGPTSMAEMPNVVGHVGPNSFLGSGSSPFEKIAQVAALELPTAPPSSLASFSNMRINPGWTHPDAIGVDRNGQQLFFAARYVGSGLSSTGSESLYCAETKRVAYQSGVTGPGIGNSFTHPMLPGNDIYRFIDNSKSEDVPDRSDNAWMNTITRDSKAYCDYWDHVFVLNDALWDDYFLSSLADQKRPGAGKSMTLSQNIDQLVSVGDLSNVRYRYHAAGKAKDAVKQDLQSENGYLIAASHLMVDGMFNVNSTSVAAWYSLFAGIRERQLVYRGSNGSLNNVNLPGNKRIAISRFDTEVSDSEMDDPEYGVKSPDGLPSWSGVRFLDDGQLMKLAEECVKQVKRRGPFLNFAEFINRRLSTDELGRMGALQSAIDYDDQSPDPKSINYRFKNGPDFMLKKSSFGRTAFNNPDAAEGSRFAGIPGYVIQSDLLKPIANTLAVRDDTFRIRAYGEALDSTGKVTARAWCEAIVQRLPEYVDPANRPEIPARQTRADGTFEDNSQLVSINRRFGRKFRIADFRWLGSDEV